MPLRRHLAARVGALAAGVGTPFHVLATEAVAILSTSRAHGGARPANVPVQVRAAEHEVGTRVADLHAIHQQPDVVRVGVRTALRTRCDGAPRSATAATTCAWRRSRRASTSSRCSFPTIVSVAAQRGALSDRLDRTIFAVPTKIAHPKSSPVERLGVDRTCSAKLLHSPPRSRAHRVVLQIAAPSGR